MSTSLLLTKELDSILDPTTSVSEYTWYMLSSMMVDTRRDW